MWLDLGECRNRIHNRKKTQGNSESRKLRSCHMSSDVISTCWNSGHFQQGDSWLPFTWLYQKSFSVNPYNLFIATARTPWYLRAKQGEDRVHNNASRISGLNCEVEYRQIPICAGHDDDGNPIIKLADWPFVLPKSLENWLQGGEFYGIPCALALFSIWMGIFCSSSLWLWH